MPIRLFAIAATVAALGAASAARSESCSNSCVTMAIPAADGVHTKLDGTADAVLWPPSEEFREIHISALNNRGAACDVTINDVRQDEAPRVAGNGAKLEDAVDCDNGGDASTIALRSDRASNGDGRAYHIRFGLADPDCSKAAKADEVLVAVPRDESVTSLKSYAEDEGTLTASYAGSELQCVPHKDDRLAGLPEKWPGSNN
ncbi:MAG TPA: hypothetical protein VN634_03930 [Candidatus Limnocylindrales bacterium]|nr:hypothetical protein [Candidatus Limnocylindrales bacterium]